MNAIKQVLPLATSKNLKYVGEMEVLRTSDQVIDALGGHQAVCELTDCSSSRVSNWRGKGKFPSTMFVIMTSALAKQGKRAPASLWSMREPAEAS